MTKEEFKENINGILIELTEEKLVKYFISNYYIRLYDFNKDISDYLLTLHDYLINSGFEGVEFEIWVDDSHFLKIKPIKKELSKIRKDITIYYKNTNKIITESKFVDKDDVNELLDKISEYGIESLTDIDRKRLNIFSENDKAIIEIIDKMGDLTSQFKEINQQMRELSEQGKDAKFLMKDWLELNRQMVPLEREIESYGIMLGDPRLTRLMKKERPDVYGDICESNKFENVKDLLTNIEGILVELDDINISYRIYPIDNDIKIKMVSLGKEDIQVDMTFDKEYDRTIVYRSLETLCDLMKYNNYKLTISTKEPNLTKPRLEYKTYYDISDLNMRNVYQINLRFENLNKILSESLPREGTVNQLKRLRKLTKGIDIGDRISDMNKQGANIDYIKNPVDTGIESFEDFEKKNKKFVPSWNLKHLIDPYQHSSKKKKRKRKK